jgi:hypothetical protein
VRITNLTSFNGGVGSIGILVPSGRSGISTRLAQETRSAAS